MTKAIREAYESYINLGKQISELESQRKTAQAVIKGYHKTTGLQIINEDGFKSQIIPQETRTLDKNLFIEKFGAEAVESCYIVGTKSNFRCERMILG